MVIPNTICEFVPVNDTGTHCDRTGYGTISVVLFKSTNVKAKDFAIYIHGLRRWITRMLPVYFKKYRFLLFVDTSTLEDPLFQTLLQKVDKSKRVSVNHFQCPDFLVPDRLVARHIGLFGTIIRFFPWFDFPGTECFGRRVLTMDCEPSNELYEQLKKDARNGRSISSIARR